MQWFKGWVHTFFVISLCVVTLNSPASAQTDKLKLVRVLGWGGNAWGYAAYSPDDKWLGVWSTRGILLFDTADYQRLPHIIEGDFYNFNFSTDGGMLAVVGSTVQVYDTHTFHILREFPVPEHGYASYAAFSPDGQLLAVADGGWDGKGGSVWDLTTGKLHFRMSGTIYRIFWVNQGRLILTLSGGWEQDAYIGLWERNFGRQLKVPNGYFATGGDVSATTNLAAFGAGRIVYLWDIEGWREVDILRHDPEFDFISGIIISPDANRLIVYDIFGQTILWDRLHNQQVMFPHDDTPDTYSKVGYVMFNPDGKTLAYEYPDGIHILDIQTYQDVQHFPYTFHPIYSTDGKQLAYIDSRSLTITVVDTASYRTLAELDEFTDTVKTIAWEDDNQSVNVTDDQGWKRRWSIQTGQLLNQEKVELPQPVRNYDAISADRQVGATTNGWLLEIWDIPTSKIIGRLKHLSNRRIMYIALNSHGTTLAYNVTDYSQHGKRFLNLLDVHSQRIISYSIPGNGYQYDILQFSDDDSLILTTVDDTVQFIDAATGTLLQTFAKFGASTNYPVHLLLSPDKSLLIGINSYITVWDVTSGQQLSRAAINTYGSVTQVSLSSDQHTLVLGHQSGCTTIWDLGTTWR